MHRPCAERLSLSFGYNKAFVVSNLGRSGGLVIFGNEEIKLLFEGIKLQVKAYTIYHINAVVEELGSDQWRLSCIYGET